ncbi:RNA pyrophosphohydrolase [Sphingobium boeckii]|uniref:RNA pyrophosphohydrolase n=1 Tax=Sphingobium boeckii TaxID=1082345 RepID=A0A7W9EF03_9SPHN|nr:RNA pyrophosphohydrolase [Sphingobium boeckii]MBB5685206.1 putative (di)nucleoside polyphosphate hydrolase [Sphingobium boeckii]
MSIDPETLPYRPCAGVMILNAEGQVFVGQRLDNVVEAWQMPQGGIDPGEDAETAARREVGEETGIAPEHIQIVAQAPDEMFYDLPAELVGRIWKGKYRGQRQIWFLARFTGTDADVNIETEHPEFRAWKWADPADLPALIVPFKKALYEDILAAFAPHLDRA